MFYVAKHLEAVASAFAIIYIITIANLIKMTNNNYMVTREPIYLVLKLMPLHSIEYKRGTKKLYSCSYTTKRKFTLFWFYLHINNTFKT